MQPRVSVKKSAVSIITINGANDNSAFMVAKLIYSYISHI